MRRQPASVFVAAILLVGCGGGQPSRGAATQTSPSPTVPTPRPSSSVGCEPSDEIFAKVLVAMVAVQTLPADDPHYAKDLQILQDAFGTLLNMQTDIDRDLTIYGPFVNGDICLNSIAGAFKNIALALGGGGSPAEETAKTYQVLLIWYPDSQYALDAENYLKQNGYLIPKPSVSP
jgi:hypothetical protein